MLATCGRQVLLLLWLPFELHQPKDISTLERQLVINKKKIRKTEKAPGALELSPGALELSPNRSRASKGRASEDKAGNSRSSRVPKVSRLDTG